MGDNKPHAFLELLPVFVSAFLFRIMFFTGVNDTDGYTYLSLAWRWASGGAAPALSGVERRIGVYGPVSLLYKLFGFQEWFAPAYTLLFSLLSLLLIYLLARQLAGHAAGLWAALLWAFFPMDVFLSALLLPDGLLVTYNLAVFLLFLKLRVAWLAGRLKLWAKILLSLGLAALLFWGFWVKEYMVYTALFLLGWVLLETIYRRNTTRLDILWQRLQTEPRLRLGVIMISALVLLAALLVYGSLQAFSFQQMLASTALDTLALMGRNDFYRLYFPLLLVAVLLCAAARKKAALAPLLWSLGLFLAHEWGTKNFNLLVYTPANFTDSARNILFIFPGLIIAAALLLGEIPLSRKKRLELGATALGITLLLGAARLYLPELNRGFTALGLAAGLLFMVSAPLLLLRRGQLLPQRPLVLTTGLVLSLVLAAFQVLSSNQSRMDYLTLNYLNYKSAAHFLADTLAADPAPAQPPTLYTFHESLSIPAGNLSYHGGYTFTVEYVPPAELDKLKDGYFLLNQGGLDPASLPGNFISLGSFEQPPTENYAHPPVYTLYKVVSP